MTSFLQMSHNSLSLLSDKCTDKFGGAVLSPVNDGVTVTADAVSKMRLRRASDFLCVLDPQLYYPRSQKGKLTEWSFFPPDFETSDPASLSLWSGITEKLAMVGKDIRAHAVASASWVPPVYSLGYYAMLVELGKQLADRADDRFEPMQSVIVSLRTLHNLKEVMNIASIVTETTCPWIYFLIESDESNPRRELDSPNLLHVMQLIHLLENSGRKVLVGYTSSDLVLWKAAGANSAATGKFLNVRRFTPSRFEAGPTGGAPGASYWFEPGLLAFIRQGDLLRLQKLSKLSPWSSKQRLLRDVLKHIEHGKAWIALGWREFLSWYQQIERDLAEHDLTVRPMAIHDLITTAEENWKTLEAMKVFMEEQPFNAGEWLPSWRKAVSGFSDWFEKKER